MVELIIISYFILIILFILFIAKLIYISSKLKGKDRKEREQILKKEWDVKKIKIKPLLFSIFLPIIIIFILSLIFGYEKSVNPSFSIDFIFSSLVLAPILEELAFRRILLYDIILNRIYKKFGLNWKNERFGVLTAFALSLQALIFVLGHYDTALGFSYYGRFFVGFFAGWIYLHNDKNIVYSMVFHFTWNLVIFGMNLI
jgi:membrane protease YdiL (CAAX protease family)